MRSFIFCGSLTYVCKLSNGYDHNMSKFSFLVKKRCTNNVRLRLVPYAKERNPIGIAKNNDKKRKKKKKVSWWYKFFQDSDDEIWSDWSAEDVLLGDDNDIDNININDEADDKFDSWKRKAEAISELREAQQDAKNAEGRKWEDWLLPTGDYSSSNNNNNNNVSSSNSEYSTNNTTASSSSSWDQDDINAPEYDPYDELMRKNSFIKSITKFISADNNEDDDDIDDDDDLLFEDRVFQYASTNSAKFVASLIFIPWVIDFLVHDYILMPFLDRYVKTVPLAAEMLDVRRNQKLEMVKTLRVERGRFQLETEIGKAPPLSDEDVWLELRHKAIELRDEWRLENRRAFANIWSDMLYGISLFILIYSNKSKVALLKFTGYKLLNNISDTGKAFLIILITDIFLGYHSESGWQALVEIILEHYGLEADPASITIFICFVPVVIDACVKLWLFKYLPRLSPNVTNIFREMKRH